MDKKTQYIFVTGGVLSGVGKGITAASIGAVLKSKGLTVSIQKCDPYLNVDAGLLNPAEHGECFVTKDGAEADVRTTGRHDPCVGIRATPIAEAMMSLVLMDHALLHRAQNADVNIPTPKIPGSTRR